MASLDGYDAVVLGSAVYTGRWLEASRRFSERHHAALRARPTWLFSSGPIGQPLAPTEEPVDGLRLLAELGARDHRTFAGRINASDLNWVERTVTRMVKAPDGDFRDWDAIRDWGASIAKELATQPAPAMGRMTDVFLPPWCSSRIPIVGGGALALALVLNVRAWLDRRGADGRVPTLAPDGG